MAECLVQRPFNVKTQMHFGLANQWSPNCATVTLMMTDVKGYSSKLSQYQNNKKLITNI